MILKPCVHFKLTVFIFAGNWSSCLRGSTLDTSGVLGDNAVLVGVSLAQVSDSEVVLTDCSVVALEPAIVVPFIRAVDFSLHNVANNLASTIIERHGPADRHGGTSNVSHLRLTRWI